MTIAEAPGRKDHPAFHRRITYQAKNGVSFLCYARIPRQLIKKPIKNTILI
jgi:hypothetical protein